MSQELEYSFICVDWNLTNKEIIKWAWFKPKNSKNYTIADYYYDTKDRILQQNKYVFRMRINPKGDRIYTIKGPTETVDGVPKRLELETKKYTDIMIKIHEMLPKGSYNFDIIQQRTTYRTEVNFDGYDLFIDKTMYEEGTEYFNIELECTDITKIQNMKDFAWVLKGKPYGIFEAVFSKFQIGEAVKALGMKEDRINGVKYREILDYFKNKKY